MREENEDGVCLRKAPTDRLFLLGLACLVLLPGLGQNQHWASREARHAEIVREMAVSGDFLVPHLLGEPYRDKPPAMHIAAAWLTRWLGEPSMGITRLPSALAAILGVSATYELGRLLHNRRVGLIGAITVLTFPGYVHMAHIARPDMLLCAAVLIACWSLRKAMDQKSPGKVAAWGALAGLAAGLGTLCKGPFGLLIPVGFAILAMIGRPAMKVPATAWLFFGVVTVAVLSGWALPVFWRDHGFYLMSMLTQPDLDLTGERVSAQPLHFYCLSGPLQTLPMFLFLPWAIRDLRHQGWSVELILCGVLFVVLTLLPEKRSHYLLPLLPFLALAIGAAVARRSALRGWVRHSWMALAVTTLALIPFYYTVGLRWMYPESDPVLKYASQLRRMVPPGSPLYLYKGHEEAVAWVFRDHKSIHRLKKQSQDSLQILRQAPRGSYLVLPEREIEVLLPPVELLSWLPLGAIDCGKEKMMVFRLAGIPAVP